MAKILIIDDRPLNRQFLTTLLAYKQHELFEASDGAEGIRVAWEQRPDLIISDVLMPTMDGYEFVRRLREEPHIAKTPVIFSTAHYLSRESQALAEKCGVTSIIYKPCEPQVVLEVVAGALRGKEPTPVKALREELDRDHIQVMTDQLALKADQLRDTNAKLTALIELSTELTKERDPIKLLGRYCSVVREVIGSQWSMVALLDRERKTVEHLAVIGLELEDTLALRAALVETGAFATLLKNGQPICLSAVTSEPAELELPALLPRAASLLITPFTIRGQVHGWICLAGKLGLDAFSEQDERLAMALATKMAIAYDNALLYSETATYTAKLEAEIAQRVRAECELSENRARLAGIIESAMDSIITIDEEQHITLFNRAAEKMFRCSAAEALGQEISRFIPERFRPDHTVHIRGFGKTGATTRAMSGARTVCGLRVDGEEFPLEASISQIDVTGQKFYTVIMRDITERMQAEAKLRQSQEQLSRIIETVPGMIASFRLRPDGTSCVPFANARIQEFFGAEVRVEDLALGASPIFAAIHPDDVGQVQATNAESARKLQPWKTEFRVRHPQRGEIYVAAHSIPTRETDGGTLWQGILVDITGRKQADEALRNKSEELAAMTQQLWQASKLATMGELAASIAHELNNPLATVSLHVENLMMQLPQDDEKRRPLQVVTKEVERMANLVNNLLQFSRRSHRQVSTVEVSEEIVNSVEFISYHLRSRRIEVVRKFTDSLPTIQADRQQLRQLFLNLLTNACDAMTEGGTLIVRATPGFLEDAEAVVIEFADSGEGITPTNLEKIWEPFFTTKPEGKGTGLGLAICRRIVEEHGGTIEIESPAGSGTTVRMVFPATANGSFTNLK